MSSEEGGICQFKATNRLLYTERTLPTITVEHFCKLPTRNWRYILDTDALFSTDQIRQHLPRLRWLLPSGLALLVIIYEVGPALWVYRAFGINIHLLVEVVVFGTIGPILAFLVLTMVERWLEERDTSDLQAAILAKAQQDAHTSRLLSDDAIQMLFAAGTLITSLKESQPEMSGETAVQVQAIENSLNQAIAQIRSHLLLPHK